MARGRFITLEGGEGVGKSTNLAFIETELKRLGIDVLITREPGGTQFGETLRDVLLSDKANNICADAELLTVFAARAEHLNKVILPALDAGRWVLSDRFTDASFAYQGGGRGMKTERIEQMEQWVQGDVRPDKVILLDAPVDVGIARASKRGDLDRFEQESMAFFESVRQAYLSRVRNQPHRYAVIDASQTLDLVQNDIQVVLSGVVQEARGL